MKKELINETDLRIPALSLNEGYARYAVSLTWLATLTDKPVAPMPFLDLDLKVISKICKIVNEELNF